MRKFVALALVALLSLTMAIAVVGCGSKEQEASQPEASPMSESGSMMDSSAMMDTSAMADTSMHH